MSCLLALKKNIYSALLVANMNDFSVDYWMKKDLTDEWESMMGKVAKFHHKFKFAENNGHNMGYRIALTVEELGELAAAVTKGKPLEDCVEEMADILILLMGHSIAMEVDLKSAFVSKMEKIMNRPARTGRLGVRVTEYTD